MLPKDVPIAPSFCAVQYECTFCVCTCLMSLFLYLHSILLDRGADPAPEGHAVTPEHLAASNRHQDVVKHLQHFCSKRAALLAEQAKEGTLSTDSLFPSDLGSINSEGRTLLMVAVIHNQPDLVQMLLQMEGMSKHIKNFKELQVLM